VPVPIARYTTFAQLRDTLISLGCTYEPLPVGWSRDPMMVFENPLPGRALPPNAMIKLMSDDAEILPSHIRSICTQLEIDPAEFGFQFPP
jgi:hypothetical protein